MLVFRCKDTKTVKKCFLGAAAMARKNSEGGQRRSPKGPRTTTPRHSPVRVSPTTAGHYAGCKWAEPPLPSALPQPPQHWMQAPHSRAPLPFLGHQPKNEQLDIENQLKVLLKVQA